MDIVPTTKVTANPRSGGAKRLAMHATAIGYDFYGGWVMPLWHPILSPPQLIYRLFKTKKEKKNANTVRGPETDAKTKRREITTGTTETPNSGGHQK